MEDHQHKIIDKGYGLIWIFCPKIDEKFPCDERPNFCQECGANLSKKEI